jgi:hypothetical protein
MRVGDKATACGFRRSHLAEARMTKDDTLVSEDFADAGINVSREVALLLSEIEKEDVPDRLLVLARDLQKALHDKFADDVRI